MDYATIPGVVLWIVLAGLLMNVAYRGGMSAAVMAVALIGLPLSAVAAWMAAYQFKDDPGLLILVPMLLPPVIAVYALWARIAVWRRIRHVRAVNVVAGTLIFGMIAVPFIHSALDSRPG